MANSTLNIEAEEPTFCVGPQAGTYCTVDSYELIPVMRVKNFDGDLIRNYEFVPNNIISAPTANYPYSTVLGLKYIGPIDLAYFYTGAQFFTFEKTFSAAYQYLDKNTGTYTTRPYSESFIIRRWAIDQTVFTLNFQEAWYRNSTSSDFFDCYDFALENYVTTFASSTPAGTGYIELTTTSGIQKYDTLLLGPSTDADNTGKVEYVYVHEVVGTTVYVRTYDGTFPTQYEYVIGNPVTRLGNFFVFSDPRPLVIEDKVDSYEHDYGYMYELDLSDFAEILNKDLSGAYKGVYGATWNSLYGMPTFTRWNNVLSVDLTNNQIFKPQTLHNIDSTGAAFPAYGIEIVSYDVLLLQNKAFVNSDAGVQSYVSFSSYNIILDSLLPYTFNVDVTSEYQTLFRNDLTTIYIKVRDQFGVGLLGKNVYVYDSGGDPDSTLDPPSGYVVTDADGYCSVLYRSGFNFTGESTVSVRSDGGNTVHGSAYVWGYVSINTYHEYEVSPTIITQHSFEDVDFRTWIVGLEDVEESFKTHEIPPLCFPRPSYGSCPNPIIDGTIKSQYQTVPMILLLSFPVHGAGRRHFDEEYDLGLLPILCSYNEMHIEQFTINPFNCKLPCYTDPDSTWMLDQLICSRHLVGLNISSTTVDQYVFVQDARPAFFSYKNTTDTDYWIRLRPFAFSLNLSTLSIKLREVNQGFGIDTGWYEIVPLGTASNFDAGGGVVGVDFIHQPSNPFRNKSIVYVYVEIYDFAPIPNLLQVEYWFEIIDDYRKPYIFDRVPDDGDVSVPTNTSVTFKIGDWGAGVNINTMEFFVNNSLVQHSYIALDEHSYYVEYLPLYDFKFGDTVYVYVRAIDLATNENVMVDSWRFYTSKSTGPWFDFSSFRPLPCRRGISRVNTLIRFRVYGIDGHGLDISTLNVQVRGVESDFTVVPIIYRIS